MADPFLNIPGYTPAIEEKLKPEIKKETKVDNSSFINIPGYDDFSSLFDSSPEAQVERDKKRLSILESEYKAGGEKDKSLAGDIEKLKRTGGGYGSFPKYNGIKVDFGDMETDTKKIDVDSITPTLTPELRSFLGLDKESSTQVAQQGVIQGRDAADIQRMQRETGVEIDPYIKSKPIKKTPDVQEKPVGYIDKEEERRYIERRKKEEQENKATTSTPKPTPEQRQEIEDEKYRRRQQESLKHLQS